LKPESASKLDSKKLLMIVLVIGGIYLLMNTNKNLNTTANV
jgi:hypothetical protein